MRGGLEDITFLGLLVFSFGLVFLVFAIVSTNLFPKLGDVLIDNANGNAVLINIGNTYKFELPFQYIEIFDKAIVKSADTTKSYYTSVASEKYIYTLAPIYNH